MKTCRLLYIKLCNIISLLEVKKMNNIMQVLNPNSPILYILIAWSIIWKGIALWHSARNKQLVWYIALLILNTVGIFEIVYLVFFKKRQNRSEWFLVILFRIFKIDATNINPEKSGLFLFPNIKWTQKKKPLHNLQSSDLFEYNK